MPIPEPSVANELGQIAKLIAQNIGKPGGLTSAATFESASMTGRVASGLLGRTAPYTGALKYLGAAKTFAEDKVNGKMTGFGLAQKLPSVFSSETPSLSVLAANIAGRFASDVATTVATRQIVKQYQKTQFYKKQTDREKQLSNIAIGAASQSLLGGLAGELYKKPTMTDARDVVAGLRPVQANDTAVVGSMIGGFAAYNLLNANTTKGQHVRQLGGTAASRLVQIAYLKRYGGKKGDDADPYGNVAELGNLPYPPQ